MQLREPAFAFLSACLSVACAVVMLRFSPRDLLEPIAGGDGLTVYMLARAIAVHGWYSPNPDLAFPFGQDLYAVPSSDLRGLVGIRIVALFTQDPFVIVNVSALIGFALIGFFAYLLLRRCRTSIWLAIPLAVAVSILPWHFSRLSGHFFLADYSSFLVGFFAVVALRELLLRGETFRTVSQRIWLFTWVIAAGLYVAWSGFYYAFIVEVLAIALLGVLAVRRGKGAVVVAVGAFLVVIPAGLFSWLRFQADASVSTVPPEAFSRQFFESELYGGSFASLFLPSNRSGISFVAELRERFAESTSIGWEGLAENSLIGVIALLVALAAAVSALGSRDGPTLRRIGIADRFSRSFRGGVSDARRHGLLVALLITLGFFVVSGFGSLFAFFVSEQIRAWGRFSVVVTVLAVVIFGVITSRLLADMGRRWVGPIALLVVSSIIVFDQVAGSYRLELGPLIEQRAEARSIADAIALSSGPSCGVLSLPFVPFPENPPVNRMLDYDHLWPYLSGDGLRISYGAVKGSAASQSEAAFSDIKGAEDLDRLREAGFCGVLVDTYGYADAGASIADRLEAFSGRAPALSAAGRYLYLPLGT